MNLANYSFEEGKKCSGTPLNMTMLTQNFVKIKSNTICQSDLFSKTNENSLDECNQVCIDAGDNCKAVYFNQGHVGGSQGNCRVFSTECRNPRSYGGGHVYANKPDKTPCMEDCDANPECTYFKIDGNQCKTYTLDGCIAAEDLASTLYKIKKSYRRRLELGDVDAVTQAIEAEITSIQGELDGALSALAGSQNDLAEVEAALSGKVTSLGTNTEELKAARDTLLAAIAEQKNAADGLTARFDEAKTEITATSDILDSAMSDLKSSNNSLGLTKEALEASKNSLNATKENFDASKDKLSSLQTQLDDANTNVTDVTSSLESTDVNFFADAMNIINDFFSDLF
jgi:predicted  nucleic acid-binding Zn-ribbon protein